MPRNKAKARTQKARDARWDDTPEESAESLVGQVNTAAPTKKRKQDGLSETKTLRQKRQRKVKYSEAALSTKQLYRLRVWNLLLAEVQGDENEAQILINDVCTTYLPTKQDVTLSLETVKTALHSFRTELRSSEFGSKLAVSLVKDLPTSVGVEVTGYCKSSVNSIKSFLAQPQGIPALVLPTEMLTSEPEPVFQPVNATVMIPLPSLFPCPLSTKERVMRETTPQPPPKCVQREETNTLKERRRVTKKFWRTADVPKTEWTWFLEFVERVSPKGSSNYSKKELMWSTWEGAYKHYKKTAQEEGQPIRSDRWMIKWMKILGVKRGRFDRYKCEKCWKGKKAMTRKEKGELKEGDEDTIREYNLHKERITTQTQLYRSQKANIRPGMFFAVFDYCTVHETAKFKLKDLNFTAFFYDVREEKIVHRYFDYWSTSCKDYNFTSQVFSDLVNQPWFQQFDEVVLWGDGGLRTKEILFYFSQITSQHKLQTSCNYFEAYHGHSVCDGHFGVGKRALRNNVSGGVVTDQKQVIDCFSQITNTTPGRDLGEIQTILPPVKPLKGIKQFLLFFFANTGEIWCKESWCKGEWILKTVRQLTEEEIEEKKARETNPLWRLDKRQQTNLPTKPNKVKLVQSLELQDLTQQEERRTDESISLSYSCSEEEQDFITPTVELASSDFWTSSSGFASQHFYREVAELEPKRRETRGCNYHELNGSLSSDYDDSIDDPTY